MVLMMLICTLGLLGVIFVLNYNRYFDRTIKKKFSHLVDFLEVDQGKFLSYYFINKNKSRTILFIPGMGTSFINSLPMMEKLSKNANVLSFDRTNYGLSNLGYSSDLSVFNETVIKLLDHLGIDKVDVMGLSMGAAYASYFHYGHPDRVSSVANIDCTDDREITESEEYKLKIVGYWKRVLKRSRITCMLSIPQMRSTYIYLSGGENYTILINNMQSQILNTLCEIEDFWPILADAKFSHDYGDTPLLVISSWSREDDTAMDSIPVQYHDDQAACSSQGKHIILKNTTHEDIFYSKLDNTIKIYYEFLGISLS